MTTQEHFTVEEASRWLTCKQPVPLKLLQKLGKDCSMLCRLRNIQHTLRATPHQKWPNEKAYPADVIREVFAMNPDTAPFVPPLPPGRETLQVTGMQPAATPDLHNPDSWQNRTPAEIVADIQTLEQAARECSAPTDNVNSWGTDSASCSE